MKIEPQNEKFYLEELDKLNLSEEQVIDILYDIIRYKALRFFGWTSSDVGYGAILKLINEYKKLKRGIE